MQRYLISYEFTDGEDQEEGAEMLINWYESGGPQNRPENYEVCLLYTSPSPRDGLLSRMPSSA